MSELAKARSMQPYIILYKTTVIRNFLINKPTNIEGLCLLGLRSDRRRDPNRNKEWLTTRRFFPSGDHRKYSLCQYPWRDGQAE